MIQIFTYQNPLKVSDGKNKYCFRSVVDQTLDSEQLIKEIVSYNSTITEADVRAVLAILDDKVKHFVNLGYKVELPFGYMFNKANGTVAKLNDGFVEGTLNHRITTAFRFKDDAAEEMTKNAAYKMAGSGYVQKPEIKEIYSVLANGKESEKVEFAKGSMIRIKGKNVSFDTEDSNQGIFLVATDKTETRISNYNRIGISIMESYVPSDIADGIYEVKLVTKPGTERYEKCMFSSTIEITA